MNEKEKIKLFIKEELNNLYFYLNYNYNSQKELIKNNIIIECIKKFGFGNIKGYEEILPEVENEIKIKYMEFQIKQKLNELPFYGVKNYEDLYNKYQEEIINPFRYEFGNDFESKINEVSLKYIDDLKNIYIDKQISKKISNFIIYGDENYNDVLNIYQKDIINPLIKELGIDYKVMIYNFSDKYIKALKEKCLEHILENTYYNIDFYFKKINNNIESDENVKIYYDELKKSINETTKKINEFAIDKNSEILMKKKINYRIDEKIQELFLKYAKNITKKEFKNDLKSRVNGEIISKEIMENILKKVQLQVFNKAKIIDYANYLSKFFYEQLDKQVLDDLSLIEKQKYKIETLLNSKISLNKIYVLNIGDKKITLKGENITRYFILNDIDLKEQVTFNEVKLENMEIKKVNDFFSIVGSRYGMDQSTFNSGFNYTVKTNTLKYRTIILNYVKQKYPDTVDDFYKFLNTKNVGYKIDQEGYNIIMEALLDNYKEEEVREILKELFIMNKVEDKEITKLVNKLILNGFDEISAKKIISLLDSVGVCTYTVIGNMILSSFKDYPVLFKKNFGFNMFNNNGEFNERELLLDMFIEMNKTSLGGKIIDDSKKNHLKLLTYDLNKMIFLGNSLEPINKEVVSKYLKQKNIEIDIQNISDKKHEYEIFEEIVDALNSNRLVSFNCDSTTVNAYDLRNGSVSLNKGEAHAMFVTGIDNRNLYLSSWGKKYFIKLREIKPKRSSIGTAKLDYSKKMTIKEEAENDFDLIFYQRKIDRIPNLDYYQVILKMKEEKGLLGEKEKLFSLKIKRNLNRLEEQYEKIIIEKIENDDKLILYNQAHLEELIECIKNKNEFDNYINKMTNHYIKQFGFVDVGETYSNIYNFIKEKLIIHLQKIIYNDLFYRIDYNINNIDPNTIIEGIIELEKIVNKNLNQIKDLEKSIKNKVNYFEKKVEEDEYRRIRN